MNETGNLDSSVKICSGLTLKNPVMAASGTFGYAEEYADLADLNKPGAIVTKGLSLEPKIGNPGVRTVETPAGMLNAIGLENVGFKAFVEEKMPFLRTLDTKIVVNFFGSTPEEYRDLARALCEVEGVDALEANISCPNVKAGGLSFGTSAETAAKLVELIRPACRLPLIVKLSPNVTDVAGIAKAVEDAGADAVSLINTLTGMAIDVETRRPILGNVTGGLSGPAIHPVAVYMVHRAAAAVCVPVIGIGGITCAGDALEFIIAGAAAVQVGTANFVNPETAAEVADGIAAYMSRHGFRRISEIAGTLELPQ
jgi:dihydroorotate dehydrogenase (NAD+) catalytic subunit